MNEQVPRVSIGIPVYNGDRYLAATMDSLLAQTLPDFEIVICDNASTDRTEEICRDYCARDRRISYHRNRENIGGSGNFRRVFELARGPYFKWSAYDDLCAPTFLEKCLPILERDASTVLCFPSIDFIDQTGAVVGHHDPVCNLQSTRPAARVRDFLFSARANCLPMFGLIRRSALARTTLLAPYVSSDQILLVQLALIGRFCEVSDTAFYYREHPDRSIWQYRSFASYRRWHDPNSKARILLPRWRLVFECLRSVQGADIAWREQRDCYLAIAKWSYWLRGVLARDLGMGARQLYAWLSGAPEIADMKSARAAPAATGFEPKEVADGTGNNAKHDG